MAAIENVTAARLLVSNLKGVDITTLTRTVTIRESVCSPYLTGEILVLDNQNIIIDMKLEGGDTYLVAFDAPAGKRTYSVDMYVVDVKATPSPENMTLKIYTISLISSEYMTDKGTLTPGDTTTQGMTGQALVRKIWKDAGFKTPLTQLDRDNPLQDGENALTIAHQKPLTAIGQVRDLQVYPRSPTGNVMFYRNYRSVVHTPLQYIYETCSAVETFLQRETWGIEWKHLFINSESIHSMIDAVDVSRLIMYDPDEFKPTQPHRAYDIKKGKMSINDFVGPFKGYLPNLPLTDSQKTSPSTDFTSIIDSARWYAICMKSRPQYLVRVPLNTGINTTVGEGCQLEFTPPHSRPNSPNNATGLYMITDLVHEVHNDLRVVNGTTSLQCLSAKPEDRSKCSV